MTKARDIASAAPAPSTVSTTELGYLDGVTSAIQTQLNQKPEFVAGKNKIINGDFGIWQRGTSFTNPASLSYTADRWSHYYDGSVTSVISRQTFTPGTAPVVGYESSFFWRWAISAYSGGTVGTFFQRIEDVRTFAGQTVTVSFWAKADAARTVTVGGNQNYGSGGSSANGVGNFSASLTTSWQRFTGQLNIPSIAGKTIGTGSSLELSFQIAQNTVQTIDIWGVQLEAGSSATAFQTATGTIQGELAACQRYYWRAGGDNVYQYFGNGSGDSATNGTYLVVNPVDMRIAPSSIDYATLAITDGTNTNAVTNLQFGRASKRTNLLTATTAAGQVQYRPGFLITNNSTAGYLGFSAEL